MPDPKRPMLGADDQLKMTPPPTPLEFERGWLVRELPEQGRLVLCSAYGSIDSPLMAYHCDLPTDTLGLSRVVDAIREYRPAISAFYKAEKPRELPRNVESTGPMPTGLGLSDLGVMEP